MKVALVTGAGSGIGRSTAVALSEAGYTLVLAGRDPGKLQATAAILKGASLAVSTDVSNPQSVAALFGKVKAEYGRLDVLFNNAGTGAPGTVLMEDLSYEQWANVVNTNLTGPFLCTQEAIRIMKAQDPMGGRIINNGSISAHAPRPGSAPYTMSKHAVTGLTRTLGLDGRAFDIACGQIDIGNALTDMAAGFTTGAMQADGQVRVEPVMDVAHVAEAVLHMARLPLTVNIPFVTLMARDMPFIGRG